MESVAASPLKSRKDRFLEIRKMTEKICLPLYAEDFAIQPAQDVSPPKWHLGHTTWFFETVILKYLSSNFTPFNQEFDYLFNSYYDTFGKRINRAERGNLSRPTYQEIFDYRYYINNEMVHILENHQDPTLDYLLELGLNHEQQHQELLMTDIKFIFGKNPLLPTYFRNFRIPEVHRRVHFIEIPKGLYTIGHQSTDFCYDNELPAHRVWLDTYHIMNRLVTNEEYLEFIKDGGYSNFKLWLMEGWEQVKLEKWKAPLYWMQQGNEWQEFTLNGLVKLIPENPVTHVSYYEAAAFAEWSGKRLPTEAEWEVAAHLLNNSNENSVKRGNFLESKIFHPCSPASNFNQFLGDCWEWTNSAYLPYPGYKKADGALGEYNGKFMINQMVLKGGSCVSPQSHIRSSYRNFFHPDKRWQFTGIRLAETVS